jgi:hypothetical protein
VCWWPSPSGEGRVEAKKSPHWGLVLVFKKTSNYFFFLAAFFLVAFFFTAFFLVAILLNLMVSKNGLTLVKVIIILHYPNFFSGRPLIEN